MLQFAVFAGEYYYPRGGWDDFQGTYATLEDAVSVGRQWQWHHVVDLSTGSVVAES